MKSVRKSGVVLAVSSLTLLASATMAFAATAPQTNSVIPLHKSVTIGGQKISTGYQIGESIVYPVTGGFNIVANPNINWTHAAKVAYLNNQQAHRDLTTLLNSTYANSPDIQHAMKSAKQLLDAIRNAEHTTTTNNTNTTVTPSTAPPPLTNTHTFSTTAWGSLNGVANQIETWDNSKLTAEGDSSGMSWPFGYASWQPYDEVMYWGSGLASYVRLDIRWDFTGFTGSIGFPPSVGFSQSGSSATYSTGNIPNTWIDTFQPSYAVTVNEEPLTAMTNTDQITTGTVSNIINGAAKTGSSEVENGHNVNGLYASINGS